MTMILRHRAGSPVIRELDLPDGLDDIFVAVGWTNIGSGRRDGELGVLCQQN